MGKVDSFSLTWGYCYFNSSDHKPPHLHVECCSEDWEIRVMIETTTMDFLDYNFKYPKSRSQAISSKYEKDLKTLVHEHRIKLMKEWEIKVSKGN